VRALDFGYGRRSHYTPATPLPRRSACFVRFNASISRPRPLAHTVLVWLCFGEGDKGTLPMDHVTEDQPIRLAAPMVRRPRRSKNEGLHRGHGYENIDDIEALVELRAEYVHSELEYSPT
jgi:hypothetical protein